MQCGPETLLQVSITEESQLGDTQITPQFSGLNAHWAMSPAEEGTGPAGRKTVDEGVMQPQRQEGGHHAACCTGEPSRKVPVKMGARGS